MLTNKLSAARRVYTAVMRVLLLLAAVLTAALVVFMIVYVLYKGLPYVTWHLISTKPSYITGAIGILPDICNTMQILLASLLIVLPLGVGAAVYLTEYAQNKKLVAAIEYAAETLSGIPSIIYGLVGMLFFCEFLGMQTSLLAGALTLVILTLPTVVRTTQESLKTVPQSYREGALGLGSGKWHMIRTVVLPSSVDGIVTGCILAIGRIVGESAALHPDELVYGLLANGFTEKCYDGKAFFATDHPVGKDKASNKGTAKLSMDAYKTARTSMMSLKNSKGRPLALVPDLLVVPPALEADARDILVADFINGTKNTMQGTAEIHVEPRLASDSAWFLLCTKRPVKPLIYQQRKKAKFVSKTNETDDNVFMSKKFIYGADSRGNAGFGFWQMAYGSDGTTT